MLKQRRQNGFTLVELMVAIVIGLVITFAVVSFVATVISNSGRTVSSTRVSQELRALTEVVARDVKRARGLQDPISRIGTGCTGSATCGISAITSEASCIAYGYEGGVGGNFRVIRRTVNGGVGSLVMATGSTAQTCSANGTQLSSNQIDVTGFVIEFDPAVDSKRVNITVQGRLAGDTSGPTQTYRTTVYIRSDNA